MLISVVIPAFNEEKYLPETLRSVFSQTHPHFDFEVIVVDDARSTDKTSEIAKKFGAKVIRGDFFSPALAREEGTRRAEGEIVCCLDADTIMPKNHLIMVLDEFKKDPQLAGLTGLVKGWGKNQWQNFLYHFSTSIFILASFLLKKPVFGGQSFAFRKSAFLKINGFRKDIYTGEDLDLGYRMAKIGKVKLLAKIFGVSSVRRIREGILPTVSRGFLSYLAVVWNFPFLDKAKEPFPAIR